LEIMYLEFPEVVYRRMRGDKGVPPGKLKKGDLAGWMAVAGAKFQ